MPPYDGPQYFIEHMVLPTFNSNYCFIRRDAMELRTGCSGWSYKGWAGTFYPHGTGAGDYLSLYSRVFDTVEIDSTFYRIPDARTVRGWKEATPDSFRFTAKAPGNVTHERKLIGAEAEMGTFLDSMRHLDEKLAVILIQLPPSLRYRDGMRRLVAFVENLPDDVKYAIEFRHNSWFRQETYDLLSGHGITLAWSEIPMADVPHVLTSGDLYLRLVGDRSIDERDFGKVVKDRSDVISKWAGEVERRKGEIRHAFVFANNHFQGFGPFTVNLFRREMKMEPADWSSILEQPADRRQKRLF